MPCTIMLNPDGIPSIWELLLDLSPVFLAPENFPSSQSLPDWAGQRLEDATSTLKDAMTRTQTKLQLIKISHRNPNVPAVRDVISALERLADCLEELIDLKSPRSRHDLPIGSGPYLPYENLNLLRNVFLDNKPPSDDTSDHHIVNKGDRGTSRKCRTFHQIPQDFAGINLLKRAFMTFLSDVEKAPSDKQNAAFGESVQESTFTQEERNLIQQACRCSSLSTSLFSHLARETACGAQHQAKLDLSGVRAGQLKMMVRKCQDATTERWLPAVFTHSSKKPTSGISAFNSICSSTDNPEPLRIFFDSNTMWPSNEDNGSTPLTVPPTGNPLQDYLSFVRQRPCMQKLDLNRSSLVAFLLAATFFQLCGSPWLKEPFQTESISLSVTHDQTPGQWHLHAPCDLLPSTAAMGLTDRVAALGVLILELETGRKALWTRMDRRSRTGSHRRRLRRLLHEWEGNIIGENKRIALSCLDFETLLQDFEDSNVSQSEKMHAIIYKHILGPIVRRHAERFDELENASTAIFGPFNTLPTFHITPSESACSFDAEDRPLQEDLLARSKKFFSDTQAFIRRLRAIRRDFNAGSTSLTSRGKGKTRIVLLDSGLDTEHAFINQAVNYKQVNTAESRSFVGSPWNQDNDMHGTNVAELTLRVAPTAEITIGKICETRNNVDGILPRLAEGINWATNEIKADIICLSLGYRTADEEADRAVDNAIKAGVLVVAAASNSGILHGRARPACLDGVICMHAADSQGWIGKMNPAKLKDETNFSTFGDGVHVLWNGKNELKAGTSYAAPIAAGFIASMLDFIEAKVPGLRPLQVEKLRRKKGMEAVLKRMSKEGQHGYDFIHPDSMCDWKEPDAVQRAVDRVKEALRDI
uniref:Peptidase S8/S53 domain-containing protein n=1 Tax=Bionectria ochroleuca TaxID=29856 RepID=A0A8H7MZ22_BIOOC